MCGVSVGTLSLLLAGLLLSLAMSFISASTNHLSRDAMRAKMLRTYFKCPPCDLSACPDVSMCVETVKESGICGCCQTCALGEGEECGMYTNKCAAGLQCRPLPGDAEPLQSLLTGQAVCIKESGELHNHRPQNG